MTAQFSSRRCARVALLDTFWSDVNYAHHPGDGGTPPQRTCETCTAVRVWQCTCETCTAVRAWLTRIGVAISRNMKSARDAARSNAPARTRRPSPVKKKKPTDGSTP